MKQTTTSYARSITNAACSTEAASAATLGRPQRRHTVRHAHCNPRSPRTGQLSHCHLGYISWPSWSLCLSRFIIERRSRRLLTPLALDRLCDPGLDSMPWFLGKRGLTMNCIIGRPVWADIIHIPTALAHLFNPEQNTSRKQNNIFVTTRLFETSQAQPAALPASRPSP